MKHYLILLLIILKLAACNSSLKNETKSTKQPAPLGSAKTLNNDTFIVNEISAIITVPDSLNIEKRKKVIGEDDFYAGADDYIFYLNLVHQFADSMKLKTHIVKGKKFIKFIGNNTPPYLIRIDTLPELWNVYFFDPKKNAKQIDMTFIAEEYNNYFN
jgi:hypothetical protein